MSEQVDSSGVPTVRLDLIASHGTPGWDGDRLTFRTGLFSGKTVTLSLDALRSIYLFFPKEFKWRLVQSSSIYRYVDLDTLSEQDRAELHDLPTQYRLTLGAFQFVLTAMDGLVVKVSWKSLIAAGMNALAEFGRHRAARLEARTRWLRQNPSTVLGASGLSMNAAGVSGSRGRFIPWYALGDVELREMHSFYTICTFTLSPAQGSGLKTIAASASPKDVEAYLAEMHFWTAHSKGGPGLGAVAAEAVTPPPPVPAGSSLARTSLLMGILSWLLLPLVGPIVAIVTGHLALRGIGRRPGASADRRRAFIGLALGYAQVGLIALLIVVPLLGS